MQLPELTPGIIGFAVLSWTLALLIFYAWRKAGKPMLVYTHFAFLFIPFFAFAVRLPCSMPWLSSLAQFCSIMWTKLVVYLIPFIIIAAICVGYLLLPRFYAKRLKAKRIASPFLAKHAERLKLGTVTLYWFDAAQPIAFSIRKAIFLSQGMFELLAPKEREAVLLHELCHIRERSSWKKFSSAFARILSPLAAFSTFHPCIQAEEQQADNFACMIQGTTKHVQNAKERIVAYEQERHELR